MSRLAWNRWGWKDVFADLERWRALGTSHPEYEPDTEPPTRLAISATMAYGTSGDAMTCPDFWGARGDGGYYVEQHDGQKKVLFAALRTGRTYLSTFDVAERISRREAT